MRRRALRHLVRPAVSHLLRDGFLVAVLTLSLGSIPIAAAWAATSAGGAASGSLVRPTAVLTTRAPTGPLEAPETIPPAPVTTEPPVTIPAAQQSAPPPSPPPRPQPASDEDARNTGHRVILSLGWTEDEWSCLDNIAVRESGWRVDAGNASSGAYGIAQALPASKYATIADDWQTSVSTQVTWMAGYVVGRYGSACQAWGFWQSAHWY